MSAETTQTNLHAVVTDHAQDNEQVLTFICNYVLGFIKSMGLKCAIELRIPDAIRRHGTPATVPDLLSSLSLPESQSRCLRSLMRLLSVQGIFQSHISISGDEAFDLTPISRYLTTSPFETSLSPLILSLADHDIVNPYQQLSRWLRRPDSEATTMFQLVHGKTVWDLAKERPEFNDLVNQSMESDTASVADILTQRGKEVFQEIGTLVDVGGGTGLTAAALAEAFPWMKCIVLDLPHVVEKAQKNDKIRFVGGDMFVEIPPADAVLLKAVLHCWNDESCIRILQRCKKAIPPKDKGGKVIVIDMVVGEDFNDQITAEMQLLMDIKMMAFYKGKERDEDEWNKLFVDAGFSSYKIIMSTSMRSIIEVYP